MDRQLHKDLETSVALAAAETIDLRDYSAFSVNAWPGSGGAYVGTVTVYGANSDETAAYVPVPGLSANDGGTNDPMMLTTKEPFNFAKIVIAMTSGKLNVAYSRRK